MKAKYIYETLEIEDYEEDVVEEADLEGAKMVMTQMRTDGGVTEAVKHLKGPDKEQSEAAVKKEWASYEATKYKDIFDFINWANRHDMTEKEVEDILGISFKEEKEDRIKQKFGAGANYAKAFFQFLDWLDWKLKMSLEEASKIVGEDLSELAKALVQNMYDEVENKHEFFTWLNDMNIDKKKASEYMEGFDDIHTNFSKEDSKRKVNWELGFVTKESSTNIEATGFDNMSLEEIQNNALKIAKEMYESCKEAANKLREKEDKYSVNFGDLDYFEEIAIESDSLIKETSTIYIEDLVTPMTQEEFIYTIERENSNTIESRMADLEVELTRLKKFEKKYGKK